MIDIHSHILSRFDDGPESIEESIKLLESCRDAGITTMCSTSHYYSSHMAYDEFTERRFRRIDELKKAAAGNGIDVKIVCAAEVNMTPILLNLSNVRELCYDGTSYILLEIPHSETDFDAQCTLIDKIVSYYNVKPIIAHVERYGFLIKNFGNLEQLRRMGCLIQIDADSLLKGGLLQKLAVIKLIKKGLADFVASDCHGKTRYQNLAEAYSVIEAKVGQDAVRKFKENAEMMLKNLNTEEICG